MSNVDDIVYWLQMAMSNIIDIVYQPSDKRQENIFPTFSDIICIRVWWFLAWPNVFLTLKTKVIHRNIIPKAIDNYYLPHEPKPCFTIIPIKIYRYYIPNQIRTAHHHNIHPQIYKHSMDYIRLIQSKAHATKAHAKNTLTISSSKPRKERKPWSLENNDQSQQFPPQQCEFQKKKISY